MTMSTNDMKTALFVPCCVDQFAPQTAANALLLLRREGANPHCEPEATCCGKALYNGGDREGAKQLGERMMELFGGYTHIVMCGSGCAAYIKRNFEALFRNTTYHNEHHAFTERCYDLCDFLVNVLHYRPHDIRFAHRVAVLDHCGTRSDYISAAHPRQRGLHDEPRQLLAAVEGLELVEPEWGDVCCGYGGTFAQHYTLISDDLAKRKVEAALAVGAEYIVSTETSCLLHLQSYIDKHGINLQCKYIGDILVPEPKSTETDE